MQRLGRRLVQQQDGLPDRPPPAPRAPPPIRASSQPPVVGAAEGGYRGDAPKLHLRCHAPGRGRVAGALIWSSSPNIRSGADGMAAGANRASARLCVHTRPRPVLSGPRRAWGQTREALCRTGLVACLPVAGAAATGPPAGRPRASPPSSGGRRCTRGRASPGGNRPVRWWTTSSATWPPTKAHTGPSVAAGDGSPAALLDELVVQRVALAVGRLLALEAARLALARTSGRPVRPAANGSCVMNGTPASKQAALTHRSMSWVASRRC